MPSPISTLFMGTPDFALPTLTALIEHPSFTVEAVVTKPDKPRGRGKKLSPTPVKQLAISKGLRVLEPAKANDESTVSMIGSIEHEYLVVVAYGQILPLSILKIPKIAPVNLHASLLPRWRGAAPIHRSFLNGDTVTGVCAMLMDEKMDSGDILQCRKMELSDKDTVGKVHDRLANIGAVLIVETLLDFHEGKIEAIGQDESKATYAPKLEKQDCVIDWSLPAEQVSLKIRGLSPSPGAITTLNGKHLKPLFAKALEGGGGEPGVVLKITDYGIETACGSGSVLITELKPEGKGVMPAHAYTLGHRVEPGNCFA